MTGMPTATRPHRGATCPGTKPPGAGLGHVQLRLRELAIQAGLGADGEQVARPLRDLFRRELPADPALPAADRLRVATAFVHGVCRLARWFDPARSVQAVPPLCVVLWHVGRAFETNDPSTLWIDFVLPDDPRRRPAVEWAHDIRMLLMRADIPHRAETVLVPPLSTAAPPSLSDVAAWGCMSLAHAYRCSGEFERGVRR